MSFFILTLALAMEEVHLLSESHTICSWVYRYLVSLCPQDKFLPDKFTQYKGS